MSKDHHDEHLSPSCRQDLSFAGEARRLPSNSHDQTAAPTGGTEALLSRQVIVDYIEEALRIVYEDDDDDDDEEERELQQEDDMPSLSPPSPSSDDS
jgi:hypothetical protein